MTYQEYKPNPVLARRLARLWRRRMKVPEVNYLGRGKDGEQLRGSPREALTQHLCQAVTSDICKDTTDDQLQVFEDEFFKILTTEYPFKAFVEKERVRLAKAIEQIEAGERPEFGPYSVSGCKSVLKDMDWLEGRQWCTDARVDYDPTWSLTIPCRAAGIPRQQCPIKSYSSIDYKGRYVSASFGYGVPSEYHYPLEEDGSRWLITTLSGSDEDVDLLKTLANAYPENFNIEECGPCPT